MPEERKLVTVLFADIVGSTALGAERDPEVTRKTLGRTFGKLKQILEAHGGTVEKFIGDAVMAVFGVPQTHDDDADRALRAAFAIRDAAADISANSRIEVALRIGVNTGDVVAGTDRRRQFLVTGDAVNAAKRLQEAASPGEIIAGSLTRRMTEGSVRYGPTRSLQAKGLGTLEATPASALVSALPEQQRGVPGLEAPLIGRDDELRLLLEAARRARSEGRPYLVTVFGPAGVGKSRLATELATLLDGGRVLRGRCLSYGQGITYWSIREVLRSDAGITAQDSREEVGGKLRSAVLAAFGAASTDTDAVARRLAVLMGSAHADDALRGVAAADVPQELQWGLRRYLERRAAGGLLALVVEDIHWAEAELLDLLEHLVDWGRAAIFVLCLARPELLDLRPGWGGGKTNAAAIALEPLTADETGRLVSELLSIDALPERLRAELVARTEGNPLYVEEFVRMLIDAGRLERRGDRWVAVGELASLAVPPTVQGVIAARLDRLPAPVKRVVQRASVMGKVFYADALAAIGADDESGGLREAARRGIVAESDERGLQGGRAYRFRHILIRDVAYSAIPKADRARLHDTFSRWLEDAAGDRRNEYLELIAHHADQAYALATEIGAENAVALGRRAFAHLRAAGDRANRRGLDRRALLAMFERALTVGEAVGMTDQERADAYGDWASIRNVLNPGPETMAEVERALELARAAGPSKVHMWLLQRSAEAAQFASADRALEIHAQAIAVARAVGDPELVVEAIHASAKPIVEMRGDVDAARRIYLEAYEYARAAGASVPLRWALERLGGNALSRGDFSAGLRYFEEAEAIEAPASVHHSAEQASRRARVAWQTGDAAGAVAHAEERYRLLKEIGGAWRVREGTLMLCEVLHDAGLPERARVIAEEGLAVSQPAGWYGWIPEFEWRLARIHLALGDAATARRYAEDAGRHALPNDPHARAWSAATLGLVVASEGDASEAERLIREALAIAGEMRHPLVTAQLKLDLARFLLAQQRGAEARPLLEAVRDVYRDPLASRKREEIEGLLRRCEMVAS